MRRDFDRVAIVNRAEPAMRLIHAVRELNRERGERLTGDTEDLLVEAATAHLAAKHPDMVGVYERHHILFMSVLLPK